MLLYNENSEKRTLTYWGLIYKNIDKEFTKNFEDIKIIENNNDSSLL